MPSARPISRVGFAWAAATALIVAAAGCGAATTSSSDLAKQIQKRDQEEQPAKLLERGRAFAKLGDNSRAEQYLSGALDGGADPKVVLPLLLRVCIAERRYRVAIDYAEPHLRRRPGDFKLRFVVASLYQSIGDTASARRELELVMKSRPDHADAHYAIAVLFRDDVADPVNADLHFREYLRLRPTGQHADEARASLLQDAASAPRLQIKTVPPSSRDARPSGETSSRDARPSGETSGPPPGPVQTSPFKTVPPATGSAPGTTKPSQPAGDPPTAPKPQEVRP